MPVYIGRDNQMTEEIVLKSYASNALDKIKIYLYLTLNIMKTLKWVI